MANEANRALHSVTNGYNELHSKLGAENSALEESRRVEEGQLASMHARERREAGRHTEEVLELEQDVSPGPAAHVMLTSSAIGGGKNLA